MTLENDALSARPCDIAVARSVFADWDLLEMIFDYVGGQRWLVMGAVCKQWQLLYKKQCAQRWPARDACLTVFEHLQSVLRCHSPCTAYSVAFSTVPLLQMACSGALDLQCNEAQFNAGRHGTQATLAAAHMLGMPWSESVLKELSDQAALASCSGCVRSAACRCLLASQSWLQQAAACLCSCCCGREG
jgi:hypothetical protein